MYQNVHSAVLALVRKECGWTAAANFDMRGIISERWMTCIQKRAVP